MAIIDIKIRALSYIIQMSRRFIWYGTGAFCVGGLQEIAIQ